MARSYDWARLTVGDRRGCGVEEVFGGEIMCLCTSRDIGEDEEVESHRYHKERASVKPELTTHTERQHTSYCIIIVSWRREQQVVNDCVGTGAGVKQHDTLDGVEAHSHRGD